MFRFMRPPRSILSMSRLPLRVEAQFQGGPIPNVQKVRFRKPGIRPRSILISACAFYVCYLAYSKIVLDPLESAALEALKNMPEAELEEEEQKPLFIPFPGTTKQLKSRPYRGSDPEWQEFIRFSKDLVLAKSVRDELAGYVRRVADRHSVLTMRCGKGMKLRRYWLDVDFPTSPPPEFERSGIEITEDVITWKTVPVDSLTVFRIRQAFWPSALAQSFWTFTKVLVTEDAKRMARILGIQTSPTSPSIEQLVARHQQLIKGAPPTKEGPPKQPQGLGGAKKAITSTAVPEKPSFTEKGSGELEVGPGTRTGLAFHAHFFRAIMAFKIKLQQTWRPAPNYPPRGSIMVSGMVELDSPKAWLVFDVKAAWDPKTKTYDARSMHLQLRRMQMKMQGPLGGS